MSGPALSPDREIELTNHFAASLPARLAILAAEKQETDVALEAVTATRLVMRANGYHPVPVLRFDASAKGAGKRPTMKSWETVCATADEAEILDWANKQRDCRNTGMLCGHVIGLDLDTPDVALAETIGALADAMLPSTPLHRIGNAPKSLRVYQADGIHHKVSTPALVLPNGTMLQVEALGEGNHFVADGIHPDTKRPYTWPLQTPQDVPCAALPVLHADTLQAFLVAAETAMREAGARTKKEIADDAKPKRTILKPKPQRAVQNRAFPKPSYDDVASALAAVPNTHNWNGWVKMGAAIFDALADDGEDLFIDWSAQSASNDPVATREKWATFRTSPMKNVTSKTLFGEARQNGWKPTRHTAGIQISTDPDDLANLEDARRNWLILSPGAPLGSARQFIARNHTHESQRTLHHQNSAFYTWERSHYVENAPEEMRALLYAFLDKAKRINDDDQVVDFDPTKAKVANAIEATAAVAQLPLTIRPPAWLDERAGQDTADIMACANGLVHLPTRALMAHTPAFFTLNALDYAFDANAADPVEWLYFLKTIWADDQPAIDTLQEIFGLLLTGETRYQKAFLVVGPKRSGKGTIARILTLMLGAANVCGPTLSNLAQNFGIQPLIGKRLAIVSDARLGGKADQQVIVERILSITGEDSLTVDRKNREAWTGQLGVRFVIMTNELPRLSDASGALAGRFVTLVMTRSFYGKEDLGLTQKLAAELPGILKWALAGLDRLKARGYFVQPSSSSQAQKEMEDLGSPIGAFLRDVCEVGQGLGVRTDILYHRWCDWCREQGRDHPGTVQTFGRDLGSAVPGLATIQPRAEDGSRFRFYQGIGLSKDDLARDGTRASASQSNSPLEPPEDHWEHIKYVQ